MYRPSILAWFQHHFPSEQIPDPISIDDLRVLYAKFRNLKKEPPSELISVEDAPENLNIVESEVQGVEPIQGEEVRGVTTSRPKLTWNNASMIMQMCNRSHEFMATKNFRMYHDIMGIPFEAYRLGNGSYDRKLMLQSYLDTREETMAILRVEINKEKPLNSAPSRDEAIEVQEAWHYATLFAAFEANVGVNDYFTDYFVNLKTKISEGFNRIRDDNLLTDPQNLAHSDIYPPSLLSGSTGITIIKKAASGIAEAFAEYKLGNRTRARMVKRYNLNQCN